MSSSGESFEDVVLPHLDAAYRLARWLTGNEHDAEDVVHEAASRAFRCSRTSSGGRGRAWFLRIVRNTSYSWPGQSANGPTDAFDEEQPGDARPALDPEALLLHATDTSLIEDTLRDLPARFRELLVLREIEDLSYQELADVLDIPIGTVMSGLSRARHAFRQALESSINGTTASRRRGAREPHANTRLVPCSE